MQQRVLVLLPAGALLLPDELAAIICRHRWRGNRGRKDRSQRILVEAELALASL
ncbi:MAG TPA: hypothetical protein VMT66_02240 [Steroidobacteraceae bacterium]|nr:hypothetical protein [Steroidobacteraceae bacterium]